MDIFLRVFILFFFFLLSLSSKGSDENGLQFLEQLLEWKIDYKTMEDFKAGAACIPIENNRYLALGLSYQLADLEYAKKIALDGCEEMKKKNEILSECKCEIIFINNNFVVKE